MEQEKDIKELVSSNDLLAFKKEYQAWSAAKSRASSR